MVAPLQRNGLHCFYFTIGDDGYYPKKSTTLKKEYNIEKNFISNNSYICIELNAHALIVLLVILRDYLPEYSLTCYAPWLLSSKPCEQRFCAARSMSNVFSTVINFAVLGLLRRLHRLQIQLNLESKSNATKIIYPRQLAHQKSEDRNCKLLV